MTLRAQCFARIVSTRALNVSVACVLRAIAADFQSDFGFSRIERFGLSQNISLEFACNVHFATSRLSFGVARRFGSPVHMARNVSGSRATRQLLGLACSVSVSYATFRFSAQRATFRFHAERLFRAQRFGFPARNLSGFAWSIFFFERI